jgi:hypothetical protein
MKPKFFLMNVMVGVMWGVILSAFVFNGCQKDTATPPASSTTDITAAEDDANATFAANDAKNVADAAVQWQSSTYIPFGWRPRGFGGIFSACANIHGGDTMINGAQDTVVYIDFGKNDCFCQDNRHRRGTIIVYWGLQHPGETWLQAYFDSNNTITETFRDYYLRDNGIAGVRTWTNEGDNINGFENWNFTANLTITYPNGQIATWVSSRNNAIVEVDGVWYYEINGSGHGTARDGRAYTVTITSPIYFTVLPWWAGGCPWPETGTVEISNTNPVSTMIVSYGTLGTCSDTKTVKLMGSATTGSATITTTLVMW